MLRELEGFRVLDLWLRLSEAPDRSVFVVARLGERCGAMVARLYEADLEDEASFQPTYFTDEDARTLIEALGRTPQRTS